MASGRLMASAASHSIMVAKSRWGPHDLLSLAHYFSKAKAFTSSASKQPCRPTRLRPAAILQPPSTVFNRAHCRRT
eukprot:scaffold3756_cov116-Skeletonema_dohrnii-CCMP3373.AAC.4